MGQRHKCPELYPCGIARSFFVLEDDSAAISRQSVRRMRRSTGQVDKPKLSLIVGNTLGKHLGVGSVERGFVLPHRFAFADEGLAIHIRSVLREHLIDQELALAGAVVHRRSCAEEPTHGGFGIRVIAAGGDDRIRRPFVDIGLQRRLVQVVVFSQVSTLTPEIKAQGALVSSGQRDRAGPMYSALSQP